VRLRSTNLLERSLGEIKRRTRVIGRSPGETSGLSLCWAALDLVIAGARGLGLTDLDQREIEHTTRKIATDTCREDRVVCRKPRRLPVRFYVTRGMRPRGAYHSNVDDGRDRSRERTEDRRVARGTEGSETTDTRSTRLRRELLAGAVGALHVAAAGALGRATPEMASTLGSSANASMARTSAWPSASTRAVG